MCQELLCNGDDVDQPKKILNNKRRDKKCCGMALWKTNPN